MIPFLHGALGVAGYASDFELIDTQTVGAGGAASVTFSSIPGTYKHLQVRAIYRLTDSGTSSDLVKITFNSSNTGYAGHSVYGNGTTASSLNTSSSTYGWASRTSLPRGGTTANAFGGMILDILDYANTSKNKTLRTLEGLDTNSAVAGIALTSSLWTNTAAITSMTFTDENALNFTQYSTFSLYGVK